MMKTIIAASILAANAGLLMVAIPLPQRGLEFQLRSRLGLRTDSAVG